jgi:ubiquinone/menaquinone biosynthesis C-methylase UbiE
MLEPERDDQPYSYDPFTQHAFYAAVNGALVERALAHLSPHPLLEPYTIVDLGCGTGAATHLIVEALQQRGQPARVIGIDPSVQALTRARYRLAEPGMEVHWVQGDATALARLGIRADALFFCNALHLVPDKPLAIAQIASALRPGGIFACNSAFFAGAYVAGTEGFYQLFMRRAIGWLRREHPEVHLSRGGKALARQWLSEADYVALVQEQGLQVRSSALEQVQMSLGSWQDISRYWLFIQGALPGAPLAVGAEALSTAAAQVFEELGLAAVPRNWLHLVAQRELGPEGEG